MSFKKIGLWVLTIISALPFIAAGFAKLTKSQMLVDEFTRWGFPLWFMYFTGATEIIGALLLLVPKTRIYGSLVLTVTMLVAVIVHLVNNEAGQIVAPIVLGLLAFATGYTQYRSSKK